MKKPKARIKRVFEKVVENHGFNVGKAMREEGYSPESAKNPKNVTESKSWEMLMDEYIPESLVAKTHKEAFNANRTISVVSGKQATGSTNDFVDVPDWQTRMKAVELGYKIRGKMIDRNDLTTNGKDLNSLIQIVKHEDNKPV